MDCPEQTQIGLDQCADQAFQRADRALNEAYREILRRLGDETHAKQLVVAAQKAWIAFRDAECAFPVSSSGGGSIYPMEYSLCLEDKTKSGPKSCRPTSIARKATSPARYTASDRRLDERFRS